MFLANYKRICQFLSNCNVSLKYKVISNEKRFSKASAKHCNKHLVRDNFDELRILFSAMISP